MYLSVCRKLLPLLLLLLQPLLAEPRLHRLNSNLPPDLGSADCSKQAMALELDLRQDASFIQWSPSYKIETFGIEPDASAGATAGQSWVMVSNDTRNIDPKSPRRHNGIGNAWPQILDQPGVIVMAWLLDGKPVYVHCEYIDTVKEETRLAFRNDHRFELTRDQLRGQAVLLYWQDGHFRKPTPRFASATSQLAFTACASGDAALLRDALSAGARAGDKDERGTTLLHYAAEAGATDCLGILISSKARLNELTPSNESPLCWAAAKNRIEACRLLLEAGARRDSNDVSTPSPIAEAVTRGHRDIVRLLLDFKADSDGRDSLGRSALTLAVDEGRTDLAEMLYKAGERLDFSAHQNELAFLTICQKGHLDMVRFLLAHGAHGSFHSDELNTLMAAAAHDNPLLARELIAAGAKPNWANDKGQTPLLFAVSLNSPAFAQALIEAGAKLDTRYSGGATILHAAALNKDPKLLTLLLEAGANPNLTNERGFAPIDILLFSDAAENVRLLASKGAVLDQSSPHFNRRLEACLRMDCEELLQDALNKGLSPDYQLTGQWSLLQVAQALRAERCAALLQKSGAKSAQAVTIVSATDLDKQPSLVKTTPLVDPRPEKQKAPALYTKVELVIDTDGSVRFPRLRNPVPPEVADRILSTLATWKFSIPTAKGEPVAAKAILPISLSAIEPPEHSPIPDEKPVGIKRTQPIYPANARFKGAEATVILQFVVDTNGKVRDAKVVQTSGEEFNAPAIEALLHWTFKPAKLKGQPVPCPMQVPIVFNIVR
jgi:TonB family protein